MCVVCFVPSPAQPPPTRPPAAPLLPPPHPPPRAPAPPLHPPTSPPPPRVAVPLVIDTDLSIDVDDVGALCVAHALADRGEARLLAVTHGTALADGPAAIGVLNHFYGRDDLPIGAYDGEVGRPDLTEDQPDFINHGRGWYAQDLVRSFPPRISPLGSYVEPAVHVLRVALSAAADRSVTIAAIGHATNLAALLDSPGGAALVARKARQLVWMGGGRLGGEWNFVGPGVGCGGWCGDAYADVAQLTRRAVEGWPSAEVPITFLPFESGEDVHAGGAFKTANGGEGVDASSNPCRAAYEAFCGVTGGAGGLPGWCDGRGRAAWDLQAVLLAVRGTEGHYTLERGEMAFADDGSNRWWPRADGPHEMALLEWGDDWRDRSSRIDAISTELDALLVQPPSTRFVDEHRPVCASYCNQWNEALDPLCRGCHTPSPSPPTPPSPPRPSSPPPPRPPTPPRPPRPSTPPPQPPPLPSSLQPVPPPSPPRLLVSPPQSLRHVHEHVHVSSPHPASTSPPPLHLASKVSHATSPSPAHLARPPSRAPATSSLPPRPPSPLPSPPPALLLEQEAWEQGSAAGHRGATPALPRTDVVVGATAIALLGLGGCSALLLLRRRRGTCTARQGSSRLVSPAPHRGAARGFERLHPDPTTQSARGAPGLPGSLGGFDQHAQPSSWEQAKQAKEEEEEEEEEEGLGDGGRVAPAKSCCCALAGRAVALGWLCCLGGALVTSIACVLGAAGMLVTLVRASD